MVGGGMVIAQIRLQPPVLLAYVSEHVPYVSEHVRGGVVDADGPGGAGALVAQRRGG